MTLSTTTFDQEYSLRGLNMVTPDQLIDDSDKTKGQSPYTVNSRIFLPQLTSDPRTAVQSRLGVQFYSIPVGEVLDTQLTATTGATDQNISYLNRVAQQFVPTTNGALTAVDLNLKTLGSNDTIRVEIWLDSAGSFAALLASSSIPSSSLTTSYQYIKARFVQAPTLSTGSIYWIVVYANEPGIVSNYAISRNTTGTNVLQTSPDSQTYTLQATGSVNFKTYISTPGSVKGQTRWVNKNGLKQSIFAFGDGIYLINNESTGATTKIATGLSTNPSRVRFVPVYDKLYIVNGVDPLQIWDGTIMTTVANIGGLTNPSNVVIFHDRAWYYNSADPTRIYFSNLYPDLTTIPAVNFQYVPDTASPDPITGFVKFQNQLVIFTKESKYLLTGDSVSTLGLSQSPGGTKGAVSQEAISVDEKVVYFVSVDGGPYYYDGAQDHPIGDNIQPEFAQFTSLADVDAEVSNKYWRIYYKSRGDLMHRRVLIYDLRYQEWLMDTETYTRLGISQALETNQLIEASSVVGALYFGDSGFSQLGAPIGFKYWTNYKKYTSGIAKDRVKTFRAVFDSPDRTITVKIGKDSDFNNAPSTKTVTLAATGILYDSGALYGDPTSLYGKGTRVSQPSVSLSGRAFNSQYRFEKDVLNTPVRLYGFEAVISSGRPR